MEKSNSSSTTVPLSPLSNSVDMLRLLRLSLLMLLSMALLDNHTFGAPINTDNTTDPLLSLPYIQYVKTEKSPSQVGTTIFKKDKAFSGYNIYTSTDDPDGFVNLINMDNSLMHAWKKDPKSDPLLWTQVTLFPDGSIFLAGKHRWQKVNASSQTLANYNIPGQKAHHAAYCLQDGSFLGLVAGKSFLSFRGITLKILNNSLVHVSPDGKPLRIIPLSKLFAEDKDYQKKLQVAYELVTQQSDKRPGSDIFHSNNIESLEWDIPGIAKKGDWLVTVKVLNRIIIVDPEQEKIVWEWGENDLLKPHAATFLEGDQILLFDNRVGEKSSRVIILDIRSKKIVWQYGQRPGQEFYSAIRGSAQRLPNGNILITESDRGRAFEVTPSGEIVWEWYADFYTQGPFKGKRRIIYRMNRIPYDFLKGVKLNYGKIKP